MGLTHDELWARARRIKRNMQARQRTYARRVEADIKSGKTVQISVVPLYSRINGRNLEDTYNRGLVDYVQELAHRQLSDLSPEDMEKVKEYLGILLTDSAPNHTITVVEGRSHSSVHASLETVMFDTKNLPRIVR